MSDIWWKSDGTTLFAIERGAGQPIILIHGGLATHAACTPIADPLAARYRVITPDLRANGRSLYAGELSWDRFADDVAALMRHLELPRAVIGGISFGAGVAVRVALRHPELVSALLVLQPAYGGAELGLTPAQAAAMAAMDAAGSRAVAEGVEVMLPLFDALPPAIRERAHAIVARYDAGSVAAITRFMASGAQPFERGDELAAVDVPALVVPGTDPTHPDEVADVFRRHLPRCTVEVAVGEFLDQLD
jgi:3-oxoadipate enol-lactonase